MVVIGALNCDVVLNPTCTLDPTATQLQYRARLRIMAPAGIAILGSGIFAKEGEDCSKHTVAGWMHETHLLSPLIL